MVKKFSLRNQIIPIQCSICIPSNPDSFIAVTLLLLILSFINFTDIAKLEFRVSLRWEGVTISYFICLFHSSHNPLFLACSYTLKIRLMFMNKLRKGTRLCIPIKTNLIYEKYYPSTDGAYICVVWNPVDCINSEVYNNEAGNWNQSENRNTSILWYD
jgi:hypothetical protein